MQVYYKSKITFCQVSSASRSIFLTFRRLTRINFQFWLEIITFSINLTKLHKLIGMSPLKPNVGFQSIDLLTLNSFHKF